MSADRLTLENRLLDKALRDYLKSPGRYSIALREPGLLYVQSRAVLAIAAGRYSLLDGASAPAASELQQAARFFIRQAFLRQGADHYTLLGLSPDAELHTIREHYRLLIRLTHPDYATANDAWPPNTAAQVNLAYGVLSVPDKRREYDAHTVGQGKQTPERTATTQQPPQGVKVSIAHPDQLRSQRRLPDEALGGGKTKAMYLYGGLATFAMATMLVFLLISTPPEDASLRASAAPASAYTPPAALAVQAPATVVSPPSDRYAALVTAAQPAQETPAVTPTRLTAHDRNPLGLSVTASESTPTAMPVVAISDQRAPVRPATAPPTEDSAIDSVKLGLTRSLTMPVTARAQLSGPDTAASPLPSPTPPSDQPGQPEKPVAIAQSVGPATEPLNMRTLQPLLTGMVEALQSGSSTQVQRWIERTAPQSTSASAFASSYQAALGGGRVIGLGQVKFTPRASGSPSQVDGTIHLNLEYADQQTTVKAFRLRAYFEGHPEAPKLSILEAR